jgi:hypothetical protein
MDDSRLGATASAHRSVDADMDKCLRAPAPVLGFRLIYIGVDWSACHAYQVPRPCASRAGLITC